MSDYGYNSDKNKNVDDNVKKIIRNTLIQKYFKDIPSDIENFSIKAYKNRLDKIKIEYVENEEEYISNRKTYTDKQNELNLLIQDVEILKNDVNLLSRDYSKFQEKNKECKESYQILNNEISKTNDRDKKIMQANNELLDTTNKTKININYLKEQKNKTKDIKNSINNVSKTLRARINSILEMNKSYSYFLNNEKNLITIFISEIVNQFQTISSLNEEFQYGIIFLLSNNIEFLISNLIPLMKKRIQILNKGNPTTENNDQLINRATKQIKNFSSSLDKKIPTLFVEKINELQTRLKQAYYTNDLESVEVYTNGIMLLVKLIDKMYQKGPLYDLLRMVKQMD